ncbi:MAG: hypothetical protein QXL59_10065 [Candidatus Jordarchaeales archaeon]
MPELPAEACEPAFMKLAGEDELGHRQPSMLNCCGASLTSSLYIISGEIRKFKEKEDPTSDFILKVSSMV